MGWVAGTFTKWRSRRTLAALAVVAVAAALVVIPTQTASAANPIANENSRPGTPGWQITKVASSFQISGYVTQPAVDPGDPVPVHVNLKAPEANHDYTVEVYRMGYYGGVGARRWFGPKTLSFGNPLADPTQVDVATGRIEADWPTAFTVDTTGYVTGTYLVRLTSVNGWQAYVPFTVRSATPTTYQFLNAHLTWQAYNDAGGNSLYVRNADFPNLRKNCFLFWCLYQWNDPVTWKLEQSATLPRTKPTAYQVTFRRPYTPGLRYSAGSGEYLAHEYPLAQWIESQGLDVGYAADYDLDTITVPVGVKALILPGHSEYWTGRMRDNLEEAENRGVGLASFGANQAYWRCRIEGASPTDAGTYNCYKSSNGEPNPDDPLAADPQLASAQFRSAFVNRPEQTVLGSMFRSWINAGVPAGGPTTTGLGWVPMTASDTSHPTMAGTGIAPGQSFNALTGGEFDTVQDRYPQIPGTRKLMATTIQPAAWQGSGGWLQLLLCSWNWPGACWTAEQDSVVAERVGTSGTARIFNAGTYNWIWGLTNFSLGGKDFNYASPQIRQLTANLLRWVAKV